MGDRVRVKFPVPDLNQPPEANSAFHPSGVGKWLPASSGNAKAGMVHFVSGRTWGVQVKLWDPLRTHAIPERLKRCVHDKALYKSTFTFTTTTATTTTTTTWFNAGDYDATLYMHRAASDWSNGLHRLASGPRDLSPSVWPRGVSSAWRRTVPSGGGTRPARTTTQAAVDAVQMEQRSLHSLPVHLHTRSLLLGTLRHWKTGKRWQLLC